MQLLVVVRVEVAMKQVGLKIVNVIGRINNTKITTMSMEEGSSITSTTIKVTSLCYVNEEQNIAISMRCLNQQEQHLVILQLPTTLLTPHIMVHQTNNWHNNSNNRNYPHLNFNCNAKNKPSNKKHMKHSNN